MSKSSWTRTLRPRPTAQRPRRQTRLLLEPLEDRCVPAVINVLSVADNTNAVTAGPGGTFNAPSLRSAISFANASPGGNTINLTVGGVYRITIPGANTGTNNSGAFAILPTGGDLTINNTSGTTVVVDGGGLDRVFDINPNPNPATAKFTVTISNVTITGGRASSTQAPDGADASGGGIRDQGNASLTLNTVFLTGNSATADGGGVAMENTASTPWTLTLNGGMVSNNHAGDAGGGVETDGSGKVFVNAGTVITGNTSVNQGAGIWLDAVQVGTVFQGANLTVTGAVISGNVAEAADNVGGGIGNAGNGTVTIVNSAIVYNSSGGVGGGFGDENTQGTLIVTNSTIVGNSATTTGGGISAGGPSTTISDSTITGNVTVGASAANGGGVFVTSAAFTLNNTIVALNFANAGGMNFGGTAPDIQATVTTGFNNFIGIGDTGLTGITNGTNGNQIGTATTPKDPLLGPLQNSGGPTFNQDPVPGSPVIDTGNNALIPAGTTTDQRGFLRITGTSVDIGADEFQQPAVTVTLTANPTATNLPFREPITLTAKVAPAATSTAPNNPVTGTVTFLLNGTTVLGTGTLDATGTATLTVPATAPIPLGTDVITARYEGDANFALTLSNAVTKQVSFRKTTEGVWDPATGIWSLRNELTQGTPDAGSFMFGATGPGMFAVVGDWLGNGTFGIGIFNQATATFQIRFTATPGAPDVTFAFGPSGVGIPVAGDWGGTGKWGIGVFDPTTGNWFLRNELSSGLPDAGSFPFGAPGSKPVVGDWDGNGTFTIGVVEPGGTWKIKNTNLAGSPDAVFAYGMANAQFIAGDWNGDGVWSPGEVEQDNGVATWKLRNSNSSGPPDITPFAYGGPGVQPVAGSWIFPSLPEFAAGGALPGGNTATITQQQAGNLVMAALQRLQEAGVSPQILQGLTSTVAVVMPLGGTELGEARPTQHMIILDSTAEGQGWFVDPTPMQDEEFSGGQAIPGGPAAGRVDALTVVLHELAHMAGLSDDDGSPLMASLLPPATRRTDGLDAVFARLES